MDDVQNASLVLASQRRRGPAEPTGEAVSLRGKIDAKAMGDRVARERPKELEERLEKTRKKR